MKLSKRKLKDYLKIPDFKKAHERGLAIAARIGLATSDETFNPVIVDFYEQVGYLPEAILNYMLLVGWSFDGSREDFTRDEMIQCFSLERVNKSPGSFDIKKLSEFQDRYMRALPMDPKVEMCLPYLERADVIGSPPDAATRAQVRRVLEAAAHRVEIAGQVLDYDYLLLPDERIRFNEKAVDKHLVKPAAAKDWLRAMEEQLGAVEPFDAPTIDAAVRGYAAANGVKIGDISQALRVATTGRADGFGTFETLALLGRERCLARLRRALTM